MKIFGKVRRPRENEIRLMELLDSGPCAVDSGPVGRCSNRGWNRYVRLDQSCRGVYELTPLGRTQLEKHQERYDSFRPDNQQLIRRARVVTRHIADLPVSRHILGLTAHRRQREVADDGRPKRPLQVAQW